VFLILKRTEYSLCNVIVAYVLNYGFAKINPLHLLTNDYTIF